MRKPPPPPTFDELANDPALAEEAFSANRIPETAAFVRLANDAYWTWDEFRSHPLPRALTHRAVWWLTKSARRASMEPLDFLDTAGHRFWYGVHPWMLRSLHEIDTGLGGFVIDPSADLNGPDRERYLIRSLMEEAIASSQIEGAAVTRNDAKELLKTGRKPRSEDEQMVVNNYRTITWLGEHRDEPLTKSLLFEIHRRITENTLDNPGAAGRFRLSSERIRVVDERDNEVIHQPPHASELGNRFASLAAFANSTDDANRFLHPVIRAVILHFMLAYDHPFVDGNGRTARALFYWSMLRSRYWLFEFLSISRIVANAPTQYVRAFLSTETDEADLTYFLKFHLHVIQRARKDLHEYLNAQRSRNAELTGLLKAHANLNHRQRAVLNHAIRHPNAVYSIESHRGSYGVRYDTARLDLADLANRGLLVEFKTGKRLEYAVPPNLPVLLREPVKKPRAGKKKRS